MTCRTDGCNRKGAEMPRLGDFGGKRFMPERGPKNLHFVDMTGQRFGRLLILGFAEMRGKNARWRVRCDCGTEKVSNGADIRAGKIISCGCWSREKARAAGDRTRTHGMSGTTTHNIWDSMIQRCTNPNRKDYARYGGAGIKVCERWMQFENFLADMGERPKGLTLDRWPDASGNYEPGNCRWATPAEQVRNSSAARMVTINGRTQCITDWCNELGMTLGTYQGRRQRGWAIERALTTPADPRYNWRKDAR